MTEAALCATWSPAFAGDSGGGGGGGGGGNAGDSSKSAGEGMTQPTLATLRRRVLGWYRKNGRDLPWRASDDPYHAMVAEFMLQQTGVGRVLPVYASFLQRFSTLEVLAEASTSDVIRAWSGMGYNRRAINLQRAARVIVEEHGGGVPRDPSVLETLPGDRALYGGGDCLFCVSSACARDGYEYQTRAGQAFGRPQGCGRGDRVGTGGGGGSPKMRGGHRRGTKR